MANITMWEREKQLLVYLAIGAYVYIIGDRLIMKVILRHSHSSDREFAHSACLTMLKIIGQAQGSVQLHSSHHKVT